MGQAKIKKGISADGKSVDPIQLESGIADLKKGVEMEPLAVNELNEIDYIILWSEFHDEFRERGNDDIEDRINEYVRFVSDLKNLSITQHNKIKETIKKIKISPPAMKNGSISLISYKPLKLIFQAA